jgi:hypothetical protein
MVAISVNQYKVRRILTLGAVVGRLDNALISSDNDLFMLPKIGR